MNKFQKLLKGNFLKNVLMLTGGTAFAQILGLVFIPVITRLYNPDHYGVISVYVATLAIISFFGSFNYEMGVPIADNDEKAINIIALSMSILFISSTIVAIVFMFLGEYILAFLKAQDLTPYKYFIPMGIFFLGLYNILTQWAYRNKDFKALTKTKLMQAIFQNVFSIGLGFLGKGPTGLLLGKVLGQSAGISTLSYPLFREGRYLFKKIRKEEILKAAKRYINFPLYTTPRRFIGDVTISLPILFISSLYGNHAVGLFGLANSVIQLPMNLVGTSVSNVFYAEAASLKSIDPKRVKDLSNKLLKNLILIGIFPILTLIFLGPFLFSLIFGSAWYDAGIYASLLSIAVFSRLIFKPISNIFDIYEKQKVALLLNIIRLLLVLIPFGISMYFYLSSYWAVGLYSFFMGIVYFLQYLLAQKILNDEIKNVNKIKNDL